MDSGRWFKKLMAGLREAGDKNLEQLKEAQEPFWNCSVVFMDRKSTGNW